MVSERPQEYCRWTADFDLATVSLATSHHKTRSTPQRQRLLDVCHVPGQAPQSDQEGLPRPVYDTAIYIATSV